MNDVCPKYIQHIFASMLNLILKMNKIQWQPFLPENAKYSMTADGVICFHRQNVL
jgi:hypothetical protein